MHGYLSHMNLTGGRVHIARVVDRGRLPYENYISMQFLWLGGKGKSLSVAC